MVNADYQDDEELQHIKITDLIPEEDGTITVASSSYYKQLAHQAQWRLDHKKTSKQSFLNDLMDSVVPISQGSTRLVLTIDARHNQPIEITRRWIVYKNDLNRR